MLEIPSGKILSTLGGRAFCYAAPNLWNNLPSKISSLDSLASFKRVSMGLTVSRKMVKNLAVRRKNERILTVSRKKMLTVKKSNHKIRYRDLLLSLMCYAFTCSGSENYNRNRKCRKCLHNLSHGCRCAS